MRKITQEVMERVIQASDKVRAKGLVVRLNLSNCDLSGLDLRSFNLSYTDFKGSNLLGSDLRYTNLQGADFTEAVLLEVDLREADLKYATLTNADVRGANLNYRSDLSWATLKGANFTGAKVPCMCLNLSSYSFGAIWDDNFIGEIVEHLEDMFKCAGMDVPEAIKNVTNRGYYDRRKVRN